MIQRIQTIYLLAIVVLGITLIFVPVVQLVTAPEATVQASYDMSALGLSSDEEADVPALSGLWALFLTTLLIPVLALVDVFLYRKRILQARLNIFLAILCLGYYGILATFIWFAHMNLATDWHIYPWACIPAICFILTLMATRAILRDEALVRSADRIR